MTIVKPIKLINCTITFNGPNETIVGGVQELSIKRSDDNTVYHNAGNLDPMDIVAGARSYEGKVKHGWLLTNTITDFMNFSSSTENDVSFNIIASANDGSGRQWIVEGVKFKDLDLSATLNDVIELDRNFDALALRLR